MSVPLEKVRFLLVDDNVHMLNILKTMLRGFGAEYISEARSSAEALARLRTEPVDIMIVDYQMDGEDGAALARRIRTAQDSPAPYLPMIMLTAHSEKSRVEAARDAGITEFCRKPVTAADVLRKIAAIIDQPRPFVRAPDFVGPDRRRRRADSFSGQDRRAGGAGS